MELRQTAMIRLHDSFALGDGDGDGALTVYGAAGVPDGRMKEMVSKAPINSAGMVSVFAKPATKISHTPSSRHKNHR